MSIFENFRNLGKVKSDDLDYEVTLAVEEPIFKDKTLEKSHFKVGYFIIFASAIFIAFFFKLFSLEVVKGQENQLLAEGNRIRSEEYRAPRGIIYDKNMEPLVKNIPLYNLEIYPIDLPRDKTERTAIYETLKKTVADDSLAATLDDIETNKTYSAESIVLKSYLGKDDAMKYELALHDLPGVRITVMPARQYENIPGLSHILGYIGKITGEELKANLDMEISDFVGQAGLESSYESFLQGTKGENRVEVDSTGKVQRKLETIEPISGNNLVTTIDEGLQRKTAELLKNEIDSLKNSSDGKMKEVKNAVAMALDPRTGGILASVSLPSYDNNIFSKGISNDDYQKLMNDASLPMLNRAISGVYPSGSIIKPVIAAAGLDKGVITENTTINDPGQIEVGGSVFVDWKNHGIVDVKKAIAESCNDFFYAIGGGWQDIKGLGVAAIDDYLTRFGFGKTTGIELSGEGEGNVPTPDWKEKNIGEPWYLGDTYHLSIGQGDFLITPLQMVTAISAVANGGKLYKPQLVTKIVNSDGQSVKELFPQVVNDKLVDNSYSLDVVRQGMKEAVDSSSGSARILQDLPVSAGGKTGTAQFDATDLTKTHAWFEAFAPYDNPEIAVLILVEGGGDGFTTAEPVGNEMLKYYFENKK